MGEGDKSGRSWGRGEQDEDTLYQILKEQNLKLNK